MKKYILVTIKDWHIKLFQEKKQSFFKDWTLISSPKELVLEKIITINPRYIFFPHWSWIVPEEIISQFECICFHSSDVPFGRGGSPIQNLIIRGHKETKISALRMIKELDAGPVYLKRTLNLTGKAQSIYEQSAAIIIDMMREIADKEPKPKSQVGEPVIFKRRSDLDNILPQNCSIEHLYNHIRMLDAESYPKSYINHGNYRIEFSDAELIDDYLQAKVKIVNK